MSCFVANRIRLCPRIVPAMKLLLSPDPPGGGSPAPPPVPPPADPPAPTDPPEPKPPPAAEIVRTGHSEREIELQAELQQERQAHATTAAEKKAREQRISELEDERRRLLEPPKPTPAPKTRRKGVMERFFEGSDD